VEVEAAFGFERHQLVFFLDGGSQCIQVEAEVWEDVTHRCASVSYHQRDDEFQPEGLAKEPVKESLVPSQECLRSGQSMPSLYIHVQAGWRVQVSPTEGADRLWGGDEPHPFVRLHRHPPEFGVLLTSLHVQAAFWAVRHMVEALRPSARVW
jgi:hypothetical protein